MIEYIKISMPLKERILFLFTCLIRSDLIISKNVEPIVLNGTNITITKDVVGDGSIGDIPFFDLEQGETKSNL